MHLAPKILSTEVKAEEDEVKEEEVEGLQLHKTEPIITMNTRSIQNTLTTLKVRGGEARDGPISPMFSVTIARSMDNMNENAQRSKLTRTIADPMSPKKNNRWPMHSAPRPPSTEVNGEEDEVEEEEVDGLDLQKT